jgi:hypothetical protein
MFAPLAKSLLSGAAALSLLALAAIPASANTWVNLGVQSVEFSTDRDVFNIGYAAGRFDSLKFKVMGNQVEIADVLVFYGNGTKEHLNVKEHLQPGELTQSYDLKGDHRIIKRIEVLYHTEGGGAFGKAKVQILGSRFDAPSPTPAPTNAAWEHLGDRNVGFISDHDSVAVGPGKGKFRAIKMDVSRHDIFVYNLRVKFQNGDVQDLPVNGLIKAGHSTGYLDLPGYQRTIDRIDVVYKTQGLHLKQAQVAMYGKH